jgi:hypothetical protein
MHWIKFSHALHAYPLWIFRLHFNFLFKYFMEIILNHVNTFKDINNM